MATAKPPASDDAKPPATPTRRRRTEQRAGGAEHRRQPAPTARRRRPSRRRATARRASRRRRSVHAEVAKPAPSEAAALGALLRLSASGRRSSGRSFDFDPASQPKFSSGIVAGVRADLTLYPLAGTWKRAGGAFSGLGIGATVDKPFWPDSTSKQDPTHEVRHQRAARRGRAALAHRPVQGDAAAAAAHCRRAAGWHSFAIGKDADRRSTSGRPTSATSTRRSARAAHPLRRVGVDLGDVRLSRRVRFGADRRRRRPSTGRPRTFGIRVRGGLDFLVYKGLKIGAEGLYERFSLTFNPTAATHAGQGRQQRHRPVLRRRHRRRLRAIGTGMAAVGAARSARAFSSTSRRTATRWCARRRSCPQNDPTLLFTNAGMVQFKDVFTGRETARRTSARPRRRSACAPAASTTTSRTSGVTARHHTFFEMLGNFSFGDYFKEDAIAFAWELLTKALGLDPEAAGRHRLRRRRRRSLGPTTRRARSGRRSPASATTASSASARRTTSGRWATPARRAVLGDPLLHGRRRAASTLGDEPTPRRRRAGSRSGTSSSCSSSATRRTAPLMPLPQAVDRHRRGPRARDARSCRARRRTTTPTCSRRSSTTAARAGEEAVRRATATTTSSMRVIADHARATAFLIADGVHAVERGARLRAAPHHAARDPPRQAARARRGRSARVCERVVDADGRRVPRAARGAARSSRGGRRTRTRAFRRTLDRGLQAARRASSASCRSGGKTLPGEAVFKLYDTYGFPVDLTRGHRRRARLRRRRGGLRRARWTSSARAAASSAARATQAVADVYKALASELGATEVPRLRGDRRRRRRSCAIVATASASSGDGGAEVAVVLDQTPFYGESGGQVGDTGTHRERRRRRCDVADTQEAGRRLHRAPRRGRARRARRSATSVAASASTTRGATRSAPTTRRRTCCTRRSRRCSASTWRRRARWSRPTACASTSRTSQPLTDDESGAVEDLVNDEIRAQRRLGDEVMAFDEAQEVGAVALFGEKYGDTVRVVRIGARLGRAVRRHARAARRRHRPVQDPQRGRHRAGRAAHRGGDRRGRARLRAQARGRARARGRRALRVGAVRGRRAASSKLLKELKELEREHRGAAAQAGLGGGGRDLLAEAREVTGIKVLSTRVDVGDPKALREVADQLRDKLERRGGARRRRPTARWRWSRRSPPTWSAGSTPARSSASWPKLVGGKGGGKPDMAQGGGTDAGQARRGAGSGLPPHPCT